MTDRRERFRALHVPGDPLVLANAWDAGTALVIQACGLPAVATTSAGISWSHGVPDGGHLTRDEALAAIARIVERIDLPVTADLEDGYGINVDEVAATARAAAAIGVAGINIEDGLHDGATALRSIDDQSARISAAREAVGADLFINARVDTFLHGITEPTETLRRADAYLEAGADGVFLPGVVDLPTITELVGQVQAPVNIMIDLDGPSIQQLAAAGVARVSLGAALAVASYRNLHQSIRELTSDATSSGDASVAGWVSHILG